MPKLHDLPSGSGLPPFLLTPAHVPFVAAETAGREAGDSLAHPPPEVSPEEAARIAGRIFGVSGSFRPLTSERDANFHISLDSGAQALLKITNEREAHGITEMQSLALMHLAQTDPELPVQRLCQTLRGQPWEMVTLASGTRHMCRLLTWIDGTMLHAADPDPDLHFQTGALLARVTRGLRGLFHPAAGHVLQWDIKQAGALRPMLSAVQDPELQSRLRDHLDHFDGEIAPRLPKLRAQLVHNDLNPHNIVVDSTSAGRPAGIIDFGDMVHTALVCDLAIAASYHVTEGPAPLSRLADLVAGYHQVLPLEEEETELLPALIRLRHITTLTITSWRAARYPENASYILRNAPQSLRGLNTIDATGLAETADLLRRAIQSRATE